MPALLVEALEALAELRVRAHAESVGRAPGATGQAAGVSPTPRVLEPRACRSSSSKSCSRRCDASLALSIAAFQSRRARSVAQPWEAPAVAPTSLWIGRLTTKLTERTASSAATTASTALS